jgi:hypothetical protein
MNEGLLPGLRSTARSWREETGGITFVLSPNPGEPYS